MSAVGGMSGSVPAADGSVAGDCVGCGCPLASDAAACPVCGRPVPSRADIDAAVMKKVALARYWAVHRRPYFARALFRCPLAQSGQVHRVAMDTRWRIYVNPQYALSESIPRLATALLHVLHHGLRKHAVRARGAVLFGEEQIWNLATDCEINDDLAAEGLEVPDGMAFPGYFGLDNELLAERYFAELRDLAEEGSSAALTEAAALNSEGDGSSGDVDEQGTASDGDDGEAGDGDGEAGEHVMSGGCGSCSDGRRRDWELPGDSEDVSDAEQEMLRRITAEQVREHAKSRGDTPAGIVRWAESLLDPQVDWRKVLAWVVRRAVQFKRGDADWTWTRLSRRQLGDRVQRPGMHSPQPRVAVVIDTSGSMSERDLTHAVSETDGVLRGIVAAESVRVLSVDAATASASHVTSARKIELVGGGGTDMRVGIVDAAVEQPDAIIVLTDGYTPWPESPDAAGGALVIAALIGPPSSLAHVEQSVPDWIETVRVET